MIEEVIYPWCLLKASNIVLQTEYFSVESFMEKLNHIKLEKGEKFGSFSSQLLEEKELNFFEENEDAIIKGLYREQEISDIPRTVRKAFLVTDVPFILRKENFLNGSDSVKQVSSKKLMSCFYTYSSFEESNFLYLKTSKKEKLYVTIAQEEAVKVLHNYFFGQSKNPSNTLKYYKHSLIRALDTIVHNDMFDSLKEKYPQAFVSHKNTEDLEKYLSLVFQLKSTHARNIVTILRQLNDLSLEEREDAFSL